MSLSAPVYGATGAVAPPPRTTTVGSRVLDVETPTFAPSNSHDTRWLKVLNRLRLFRNKTGHCSVPLYYLHDRALGVWCNAQRASYRKGTMSTMRLRTLEAMGFEWYTRGGPHRPMPEGTTREHQHAERKRRAWDESFAKLRKYKEERGDTLVSQRPADGNRDVAFLGGWVSRQRKQYALKKAGRPSTLTDEMEQKLDSVGFAWVSRTRPMTHKYRAIRPWGDVFASLVKFKERHGHFDATPGYAADRGLCRWIEEQRHQYCLRRAGDKVTTLTEDRLRRLEGVGFDWRLDEGGVPRVD